MRPIGHGKALLRLALAVVFGFVSLHGPVMASAKSSAAGHEISAARCVADDHSRSHADHDHFAPQAPEKASVCYPTACCIAVAAIPTSAPAVPLALLGRLDPSSDDSVLSANLAPPEPPPRLQA